MRVLAKILIVTACAGAGPAFAEGTALDMTPKTPGTVTQSALSNKIQYQGAFDDRLSAMDDKIARVRDRSNDADVAGDAVLKQALLDAQTKYAAAEARLQAFKDMKVDGWEAHKQGLEQTFADADKAVTSAEQALAAH